MPARYFVRHRRARRYVLRVDPDGRVRVTIPRGGSQREAASFADRQHAWIDRQLGKLRSAREQAAAGDAWGEPRRTAARAAAADALPPLVTAWAVRLGLQVSSVSIRNQRTRWGSCGRNGRITLNWRLMLMPAWVRDYVIVHELIHLRRMDHSKRYWALVEAAYPAYREAQAWLKDHGAALR